MNARNGLLCETGHVADLERKLKYLVSHPGKIAEYARNIPRVKTIADDASFYSTIYQGLALAPVALMA